MTTATATATRTIALQNLKLKQLKQLFTEVCNFKELTKDPKEIAKEVSKTTLKAIFKGALDLRTKKAWIILLENQGKVLAQMGYEVLDLEIKEEAKPKKVKEVEENKEVNERPQQDNKEKEAIAEEFARVRAAHDIVGDYRTTERALRKVIVRYDIEENDIMRAVWSDPRYLELVKEYTLKTI